MPYCVRNVYNNPSHLRKYSQDCITWSSLILVCGLNGGAFSFRHSTEDLKEIAEMVLANVVAAIIVSAIERRGSTHQPPKHMR